MDEIPIIKYIILITASLISISGLSVMAQSENETTAEVKAIGEPQNCIRRERPESVNVIDDFTIEFTDDRGNLYRNILPVSCPIVRNSDRFSFRKFNKDQLCRGDQISSLETFGNQLEIFGQCSLGQFQQIEKPKERL